MPDDVIGIRHLARVLPDGLDFPVEGGANIYPNIGLIGAKQKDLFNLVRLKAAAQLLREITGIACRHNGIEGGKPSGAMVGMKLIGAPGISAVCSR